MDTFEAIFTKQSDPYFNSQILSDATIKSKDGKIFHIHKMILFLESEYFRSMFTFDVNRKEFSLDEIKGCILEQILVYIYTSEISLNLDQIQDLLIASDFLMLDKLKNKCSSFAKKNITVGTCLPFLNIAWTLKIQSVIEKCYRFLQLNFDDIIGTFSGELGSLDFNLLKTILAEKSLDISSEKTIWDIICTWTEHDLPVRLSFVPDLLTHLDIKNIDDDLSKCIITHSIISDNIHCKAINEMKTDVSAHAVLENHMIMQSIPVFSLGETRSPSFSNVVVKLTDSHIQLLITFDAKFDFCHLLCDLDTDSFPEQLILIGHDLQFIGTENDEDFAWDLLENVRKPIRQTFTSRFSLYRFSVVLTNGNIYCIDRNSHLRYPTNQVERYVPESDEWSFVTPMPQMIVDSVSNFDDKIYAFGYVRTDTGLNMHAMTYNPETDTWSESIISPPAVKRFWFLETTQYRNKLLLVGRQEDVGIELVDHEYYEDDEDFIPNVEEYDPESNLLVPKPELPTYYHHPKPIVLSDTLFIYENCSDSDCDICFLNLTLFWDETSQTWEGGEFSPPLFNDLHLFRFCKINNPEIIKKLKLNRKMSDRNWRKNYVFK